MKIKLPKSLQKYVSDSVIELPLKIEEGNTEEERVIVVVTRNSDPILDAKLYADLVEIIDQLQPFTIDSLIPLPLLSLLAKEAHKGVILRLITLLFSKNFNRITVVKTKTIRGLFGGSQLINSGITGVGVATALKAALTLPLSHSWVDISLVQSANLTVCDANTQIPIDGIGFCRVAESYQ